MKGSKRFYTLVFILLLLLNSTALVILNIRAASTGLLLGVTGSLVAITVAYAICIRSTKSKPHNKVRKRPTNNQ